MSLHPSNLIGIWSCQGGGWLWFDLIFRPDGVGRAEAANCVLTNAWVFNWRLEGDDLLINGREEIELNERQDGVDHVPWAFAGRIRVTLGSVTLDSGVERRLLSLASPLAECLPSEYIDGSPKCDLFAEPDFSWIGRLGRRQ